MPFLSPYLQSIGSDFRHGANFATLASTVLLPNTSLFVSGISPFSLAIQLNQMKQFKVRVDEFHSSDLPGIFKMIYTYNNGKINKTNDVNMHMIQQGCISYRLAIFSENRFIRFISAKTISHPI